MEFSLEFVKHLIDNLGKLLGDKCEILLHDFSNGLDSTIVHIVNGGLSGREVGGCPTNVLFEHYTELGSLESELSSYFNTMPDGRLIKSSSTFIKDSCGNIVGAICINLDVSDMMVLSAELMRFLDGAGERQQKVVNENFALDVNMLMEDYLSQVQAKIGKSAKEMNKQEKMAALAYLESKGILQIVKANVRLCDFFGISKFTLYNYLNEIHANQGKTEIGVQAEDAGEDGL